MCVLSLMLNQCDLQLTQTLFLNTGIKIIPLAAAVISNCTHQETQYLHFCACAFHCDYNKRKKIYSKLTSPPFHVRKEVIIVLYTADEEKPIAAEGRTFDCRSHRRVEDGRLEAPEI